MQLPREMEASHEPKKRVNVRPNWSPEEKEDLLDHPSTRCLKCGKWWG